MLVSPVRDRSAERRTATRSEILDAAWHIAREKGLAELTLRDVAARVGMRAPSLYSYFASKNDVYDAMFGQAWTEYLVVVEAMDKTMPRSPRVGIRKAARAFFDFATADLARYQLMNQRTISGFKPTALAYAPAVEVLERVRAQLRRYGVVDPASLDLITAVVGGLVDAQLANDPGGDRWSGLLDHAMDMIADDAGIPTSGKRLS